MKAVVFDLDDTLYPESAFVESALEAVIERAEQKLGLRGFGDQCLALRRSGVAVELFQSVLRDLEIREPHAPIVADLVSSYRAHAPKSLPWHEDARNALDRLGPVARLGLISDGYLPTQERKAEALGLARYIPDPIFTERLGRAFWKPHRRAFELVMERCPATSYTYVGDNPSKDFAGPRALGWQTIRVRRPGGIYFNTAAGQAGSADVEITDLDDLEAALER